MTWFRVDDKLHDHPKVRKLRGDKMPAIGLWSLAGSWAADNLTDGFVPTEIVQRFDPKERYAGRLVEVGMWLPTEHDGEVGYRFHEWGDWQPTKVAVEKQREDNRERVRRWRERNGQDLDPANDAGNGAHPGDGNAPGNALQDRSVMDPVTVPPTRPDPTSTKKPKSPPRAAQGLDQFEEFYAAYPRHIDRKDAEKAWSNAIKTYPPDGIIAAAKRYADAQRGKEAKFTKYPATWLNKGGYLDEPELPDLRLVSGEDGARRDPKTGRVVESWR